MTGRFFKKALCVCLAVLTFAPGLVSCSEKNGKTAMEYVDPNNNVTSSVSQGFMSLWIAVQKNASAEYLAFVDSDENGWSMVLDEKTGETFSELYRRDCTLSLRNLLAAEYVHDYVYGIEFTDEQQKSVEQKINTVATSFGSEKALEEEMQKYGATVKDYERYLCLMLKQTTLFNSFYGENGIRAVSEEDKMQYFKDKYAIVYHIYIDTRGVVKDDGTVVSLTAEEKAQKAEYANGIYDSITSGEISFEEALLLYTEDSYASSNSMGYFVTRGDKYPAEFTDAALRLAVGDVTMAQTASGIHIIKRYEMDETLYSANDDVYTAISQALISEDFSDLLSSVSDGVKIYDDVIAELDAALIKPFAGF